MEKEWLVTVTFKDDNITFKDGIDITYKFIGSKETAERDAYLTFPEGSITGVLIEGPSHEDEAINTLDIKECAS